jgi:hypothetical protein
MNTEDYGGNIVIRIYNDNISVTKNRFGKTETIPLSKDDALLIEYLFSSDGMSLLFWVNTALKKLKKYIVFY